MFSLFAAKDPSDMEESLLRHILRSTVFDLRKITPLSWACNPDANGPGQVTAHASRTVD